MKTIKSLLLALCLMIGLNACAQTRIFKDLPGAEGVEKTYISKALLNMARTPAVVNNLSSRMPVKSLDGLKGIEVVQNLASVEQRSRLNWPCLLTVELNSVVPRLPSYRLKRETADRPIRIVGFDELPERNLSLCGLVGSPTRVEKMFPPAAKAKNVHLEGGPEQEADALVAILREKKLLETEVRA